MANWWDTPGQTTQTNIGAVEAAFGQLPYGHVSNKNLYKKVRRWQDYYRLGAQSSLLGIPGSGPLDPLAQLQASLQGDMGSPFTGGMSARSIVGRQNQAFRTGLEQQSAGMGVQGGYMGLIGQQQRIRDAMIERAQAAYEPARWQQEQQWFDQRSAILRALSQAETETSANILLSGRNV